MDWRRLLRNERLQATGTDVPDPYRTPYQKDLDRIVFSSAFRRMQDKTQVHPLPESDYVRTRLTHSLEVASVGRSLGTMVGSAIIPRYGLQSQVTADDIGTIIMAACLAHDIGNPPFGHAGEDAVRDWFHAHPELLEGFTDSQRRDFMAFEGNAQGFRTITRLQNYDNEGGLQLTYATLGAFTKYPRASGLDGALPGDEIGAKKFGFFQAETAYFEEVADALGLERRHPDLNYWTRHPLAFLLEAADDICYTIIDFEDGFKLKLLPFEDVETHLVEIIGSSGLGRYHEVTHPDKKIAYLRARAIGALIKTVAEIFLDNEPALLEGRFTAPILDHAPNRNVFETVARLTQTRVFTNRRSFTVENIDQDIIAGLLDRLSEAISCYNREGGQRASLTQPMQELIRQIPLEDAASPYHQLLAMTDYISGMTDSFALELFKRHSATLSRAE